MRQNKILQISINNSRFDQAKRKAILEEPTYESYMPPIPKYTKVEVKKDIVWWWNFFKTNLRQLNP